MGKQKLTTEDLADLTALAERRTLWALAMATSDQWHRGCVWYAEAHALAADMAAHDGLTLDQTSAILAALSPQIPWDRNVAAGIELSSTGDTREGVLPLSRRRAQAIRSGACPYETLGGPKVRRFAHAIRFWETSNVVVLDTIMCQLFGMRYPSGWRKGEYEALEAGVRRAARAHKLMPHQAQAIAWLVLRETESAASRSRRRATAGTIDLLAGV